MLSYNESLKILKETEAIQEGHFILSSGLHTNKYIQCAKLLSLPNKGKILCESLAEKIKKIQVTVDIVLSPALGGIVVGYEIGRQLNIKTIFAERENNQLILRRGFSIPKKSNVLIVEDVITTGKSALECSNIVKDNGANIVGYACLIDRSGAQLLIKNPIISQIKLHVDTFKEKDLPNDLKKIPAMKPGSRNINK